MRIILTGGGTGGHIYPALAIAEKWKALDPDSEILYVGTQRGLESKIVPKRNVPFRTIRVEGLPRKISPALIKALFRAGGGCVEAWKVVKDFRPDLVIGTGGYVCGPVALAARMQGVPAMIHEQNAFPGITNKLLARFVNKIMITFPESAGYFSHKDRIETTGLPVRQEVLDASREAGLAYFGFDGNKTTLLVSGGSRGARSLNRAMAEAYSTLVQYPDLQILHLTGEADYNDTMEAIAAAGLHMEEHPQIQIRPYLDEMQHALAAADFCVGRAGATFLAEITACGIPSILIPYPYAAENHQEYNAKALVDNRAARMILDKNLNGEVLCTEILDIYQHEETRKEMAANAAAYGKPDALDRIIDLIRTFDK